MSNEETSKSDVVVLWRNPHVFDFLVVMAARIFLLVGGFKIQSLAAIQNIGGFNISFGILFNF